MHRSESGNFSSQKNNNIYDTLVDPMISLIQFLVVKRSVFGVRFFSWGNFQSSFSGSQAFTVDFLGCLCWDTLSLVTVVTVGK